ncbi:BTB/POZ domain-containing protein 9 [Mactra antiquata]
MLLGPAADSNKVIEISDIKHDIFDNILRYMYTDICELTRDNVLSILDVAQKYCLHELVDQCSIFLEHSVTSDNVCVVYEHAKMYDMNSLVTSCFRLMIKESSAVCKSDSSVCLSQDSLIEFLSSKYLTGEELDHFMFADKWANNKCLSNGMEPTPDNKRNIVGDVVKKISYQRIKTEDIANFVARSELLLPEELKNIFRCISTGNGSIFENFSPARRGFLIAIDCPRDCPTENEESFCFQFSCNTKATLKKLYPIRIDCAGGTRDFGKHDITVIVIHTPGNANIWCHGNLLLDNLDESADAVIIKDIRLIFAAHQTYTINIYIGSEQNGNNDVDQNVPFSYGRGSNRTTHSIATCYPNKTFSNGSFSCTIQKIPQCVEFVEFMKYPP